jgi:hypothetical protein
MRETRTFKNLFEKFEEKKQIRRHGIDGMIMLKWILRKYIVVCGLDSTDSG